MKKLKSFYKELSCIVILFVCLLFLGCASTNLMPIDQQGQGFQLAEDERKIWDNSRKFEKMMFEKGMLYWDPALDDYINALGQKLVPDSIKGTDIDFKFVVIRNPTLNAFAFPNGSIYVHTGLLARLENEAQLAFVLGHEITHVVERHQISFIRNIKNKTIVFNVLDILGTAASAYFGVYGDLFQLGSGLIYAASVTGFGRENERRADQGGMKLMYEAGYDIKEVPKIFSIFLEERKDPSKIEIFFYGSHPASQERLQTTEEMLTAAYASQKEEPHLFHNLEEYQKNTCLLIRKNAGMDLSLGRYKHASAGLAKYVAMRPGDPLGYYYQGEVHRLILKNPHRLKEEEAKERKIDTTHYKLSEQRQQEEFKLALEKYNLSLSCNETCAEAHRGLGLLYFDRGDKNLAIEKLKKYLELNPKAKDRRFINSCIKKFKAK